MDLVSGILKLRGAPNHPVRRALRRVKSIIPYSLVEGALARLLWLQNAGIGGRWPHVGARTAAGTPGVNVYGFLNRPLGLGEAARSSLRALEAAGVPVSGVAFEEEDLWRAALAAGGRTAAPHCVNLCHVNAGEAGFLVRAFGPGAFRGRFNIGYWFWELATLPAAWDAAFGYFDEIWVASTHVERAVAARSPVTVTRIPPCINVAVGERDWRAHFGIPGGRAAFLCMFDTASTAVRKNPLGAIRAARKAFQGRAKGVIVVKASRGGAAAEMAELRAALEGADAVVIDECLSREDAWGLIAACDAYISLHRAEGFGLVIAEAMALGKPVVATGYSGNMDFMNEENSYPVEFRMTANPRRAGPYQKRCVWAEPDVDCAAARLGEILDSPETARSKGAKAAEDIARQFSPEVVGKMMRARLEAIGFEFA